MQHGRFPRQPNQRPVRLRGPAQPQLGPRGPPPHGPRFHQRGPPQEFQAPRGPPPPGFNANVGHGGAAQGFQGNMGPPAGPQGFHGNAVAQRGPHPRHPASAPSHLVPQPQPLLQSKYYNYTLLECGVIDQLKDCSVHTRYILTFIHLGLLILVWFFFLLLEDKMSRYCDTYMKMLLVFTKSALLLGMLF